MQYTCKIIMLPYFLKKKKSYIYTKEQTLNSREIWEVQQKHQNISVFLLDNITIVNK